MKYIYIFFIFTIIGCCDQNFCFVQNEDTTILNIEELQNKAKLSFEKSEKEIFVPKPDIVEPKPNPDPAKCICNGTGIIIHGDGHKTFCPFHTKSSNRNK